MGPAAYPWYFLVGACVLALVLGVFTAKLLRPQRAHEGRARMWKEARQLHMVLRRIDDRLRLSAFGSERTVPRQALHLAELHQELKTAMAHLYAMAGNAPQHVAVAQAALDRVRKAMGERTRSTVARVLVLQARKAMEQAADHILHNAGNATGTSAGPSL